MRVASVFFNPVYNNTSWDHNRERSIKMTTTWFAWQLMLSIVIDAAVRLIVFKVYTLQLNFLFSNWVFVNTRSV